MFTVPCRPAAWFPLLCLPALLFGAGCRPPAPALAQTPPATASAPPPTPAAPAFDAARAFGDLQAQCAFGPRPPLSSAHERCKFYILTQLAPNVDKTDTQTFTFHDSARGVTLPLTNIIGVINPDAPKKVLLFTHWDTRPTADQELDAADRKKPIVGADDGASGTAVLLELARKFHAKRPTVGVVLLFVDGEDWGPTDDKMYLGARQFAAHPGVYKPAYAILLDMVGQKNLTIYREGNGQNLHPDLNDKVWAAAASLGDAATFPDTYTGPDGVTQPTKYAMGDDHDAFNAKGIPAIDLIDFDYAGWHTLRDTPDKCDPKSLQAVGEVVAKVVYDEK